MTDLIQVKITCIAFTSVGFALRITEGDAELMRFCSAFLSAT